MSIDKDTAAKVAKLARIKVEDDQLDALAGEFNAVLGFIEQLNEVDVEGVEPMVSVTPMRHILNAVMLGWMIEVYRRHVASRAQPDF